MKNRHLLKSWIPFGATTLLIALACLVRFGGAHAGLPPSSEEEAPRTANVSALQQENVDEEPDDLSNEAPSLASLDWPFWRGPDQNGTSRATGLIDDFDPEGGPDSNIRWSRDDLGGRSTPIAMHGKLYLLLRAEVGTPIEGERIVCLDASTGETLWEKRFNVSLSDVPDIRVGWSSVVGDPTTGLVYAQGVNGFFQCLDGNTGETVWSVRLHESFGALSTYGGRTNFPVIFEDLVITSAVVIGWGEMAKPAHRFIAFSKETGEVVWFNGTRLLPYDTTYSTPTLAVVNGQMQLILASGDGAVWGLQPRTGKQIWHYQLARRGLNASPTVVGDVVYAGNGEENLVGTTMGSVVAIRVDGEGDLTETSTLWCHEEYLLGKTAPLYVDGRIYVFDDGAKLFIFDAETGEQIGDRVRLGTVMRSTPLYADGKFYVFEGDGRWYILRPTEEGVERVSYGRMTRGEHCHAAPIVSRGCIYLATTTRLLCLGNDSITLAPLEQSTPPAEPLIADDPEPAHVQLVPAELLIEPGERVQFRARLFNSHGQFLREVPATYAVESGEGAVSAEGEFLAPAGTNHYASIITATVGELTGSARVRVVPPLPWAFDFDDISINPETGRGNPPITWVGARYRHIIREVDGNQVMVKISTIPKGARSRCWLGHSEMSNYTISADVQGAIANDKMPDIGITAQGYCLDMQGASQRLQIRSWVPRLRMATTIDFNWDPERWYTMKLQTCVEDGRGVLRGKVWPRDEAEPEAWTIEAYDESPNLTGSPGLYGNAKDAEIFYDNLTVTPNE